MSTGNQLPVQPDAEAEAYPHVWRVRKYLPERKGQRCRITVRGRGPGPRNLRVEFPDGFEVVTAWSSVRRAQRAS